MRPSLFRVVFLQILIASLFISTNPVLAQTALVHVDRELIKTQFDSYTKEGNKIILSPKEGQNVLYLLRSNMEVENTTSCRREQKAVIGDKVWEDILRVVRGGNSAENVPCIPLVARDENPSSGKNSTITFYGKGATFMNSGVKTNLILRARFYMQVLQEGGGATQVKRSPATKDAGWLELKIRNPSPELVSGVNKFRVKLDDQSILSLLSSNPWNSGFSDKIKELRERAKQFPENNKNEVDSLFTVVEYLSKRDIAFLQPQVAVTYERTAYKYLESNYPYEDQQLNVEYQITNDRSVVFHRPEIDYAKGEFDLIKYYNPDSKLILGKYPEGANVVEFKDPFPVATLTKEAASPTHRFLLTNLLEVMQYDHNMLPGFCKNRGKAGHFRATATRIINDSILKRLAVPIAFAGMAIFLAFANYKSKFNGR